jgi:hypothetical protein
VPVRRDFFNTQGRYRNRFHKSSAWSGTRRQLGLAAAGAAEKE